MNLYSKRTALLEALADVQIEMAQRHELFQAGDITLAQYHNLQMEGIREELGEMVQERVNQRAAELAACNQAVSEAGFDIKICAFIAAYPNSTGWFVVSEDEIEGGYMVGQFVRGKGETLGDFTGVAAIEGIPTLWMALEAAEQLAQ